MRRNIRKADSRSGKNKVKPIKNNRRIKLNKKQLITLISCISALLFIIAINNYTAIGLVLNKNIDSDDVINVELQASDNKIVPYGNEILVYNRGRITCYNNYGKNTGEIVLEDTIEADILTSGKYIQVINRDRGIVYIYKNKYEVARIKIDGTIYGGNINEDGTSVIEYSINGNKTELGIYDSSGKKKYNIKLNSDIVGKYVLSDNSKYLVYTSVNVKGISAYTNINLIDLSDIKQDESNTKVIYTTNNSLAYDVYWDGKNIIARFDDSYAIYNTTFDKFEKVNISKEQVVSIGDYNKRFAYTSIDENGNYRLCISKMKSEKVKSLQLEETPKYFKYENGVVYVAYSKKVEAYNNFGVRLKTYESNIIVTEPIIFNNGRSLAMIVSNKLIMFTI